MLCNIERLTRHPAYILTVLLIVLPIDGALIAGGQVVLGSILIIMQAPWAFGIALRAAPAVEE